jgi:hypothetical protein
MLEEQRSLVQTFQAEATRRVFISGSPFGLTIANAGGAEVFGSDLPGGAGDVKQRHDGAGESDETGLHGVNLPSSMSNFILPR